MVEVTLEALAGVFIIGLCLGASVTAIAIYMYDRKHSEGTQV